MPGKMKKAKLTAAKRTMRTAETRLAKGFTAEANLKSKDVKEKIQVQKAPSSSSPNGVLRIRSTRFPLWKFSRSLSDAGGFASQEGVPVKKRKPKVGAGWKIYKSEGKKRHRGFFIARDGRNSQFQIMRRPKWANGGNDAVPGVDYRIAYGVSLVEIDRRKRVLDKPIKGIREVYIKNLESQVDRFLKRKRDAS